MIQLSALFEVRYGVNLELNALKQNPGGINFVSRTATNNGVSARVEPLPGVDPIPAGVLSVAGGGSVLETFLQPEPFYSGRDLYYLTPKTQITDQQKLYYCCCIRANKYRYNYGRQANRTLKEILLPSQEDIPSWVHTIDANGQGSIARPAAATTVTLPPAKQWKAFRMTDLFEVKKGRRIIKAKLAPGAVPFITAIDNNNSLREYFSGPPIFSPNTLTVPYNGNGVAEAFYQPAAYWACDDVNVLQPKFPLTPAIGLFLATLIRREKYRFSYGRKWHKERMEASTISLPVQSDGTPDWALMEKFIRTLPFSSQLDTTKRGHLTFSSPTR
jgi:hypothetical protein